MASDIMKNVPSLMTIGSDIRVTLIIWENRVLELLMRGICDVQCWNGLSWNDINTKLNDDLFRNLSIITVITATIWEAVIFVLLIEGI
jgi:hypothetical protein